MHVKEACTVVAVFQALDELGLGGVLVESVVWACTYEYWLRQQCIASEHLLEPAHCGAQDIGRLDRGGW